MTRAGPLWTRARLERVMSLRFGVGKGGRPDTAAAAAEMGVSRRTVQRWLHAHHGRSLAQIPPARLEQLIGLLEPSQEALADERAQAAYARKALTKLSLPRKMGILPSWEKQRWLEPHVVVILEIRIGNLRIRQIAVARNTPEKVREVTRRGAVLDQLVVPTRFHATVLSLRLLDQLRPWRFQAGPDQVRQGFTRAWLADAPDVDLAGMPRTGTRRSTVTGPGTPTPSVGDAVNQQPREEAPGGAQPTAAP